MAHRCCFFADPPGPERFMSLWHLTVRAWDIHVFTLEGPTGDYTAGMCDVTYIGVYNIYLHGKCFLSALYNDIISLTPPRIRHYCLCLTTQVHTCMPFLEALHYAQTYITLPAEIRGLCLLLQRTHSTLALFFSFRRPVLGMFDFQSTELGRSWTWSAP